MKIKCQNCGEEQKIFFYEIEFDIKGFYIKCKKCKEKIYGKEIEETASNGLEEAFNLIQELQERRWE